MSARFLFACVFGRTHRCAPTFVCPCVLLSYCLAVGADRCVCPVFRCRCFWAHTGAPLHCLFLCSFVLLSCRRGRPVCLPVFSLPVFLCAHIGAPLHFVVLCLIVFFVVGADRCVCPFSLCLCIFGRTHRCAPTIGCNKVLKYFAMLSDNLYICNVL